AQRERGDRRDQPGDPAPLGQPPASGSDEHDRRRIRRPLLDRRDHAGTLGRRHPSPPAREAGRGRVTLRARLAIAIRTVLAAALVVALAGVVVRGVASSFAPFQPYPGHTSNYGFGRPRAIREALPAIADGQDD